MVFPVFVIDGEIINMESTLNQNPVEKDTFTCRSNSNWVFLGKTRMWLAELFVESLFD